MRKAPHMPQKPRQTPAEPRA